MFRKNNSTSKSGSDNPKELVKKLKRLKTRCLQYSEMKDGDEVDKAETQYDAIIFALRRPINCNKSQKRKKNSLEKMEAEQLSAPRCFFTCLIWCSETFDSRVCDGMFGESFMKCNTSYFL